MSEAKPFASLSSGLLARKGAARPAMRPQGFGQIGQSLEDLGWDDMGFEPPKPAEHVRDAGHDAFGDQVVEHPRVHPTGLTPVQSPVQSPVPSPVHEQQAEIAARVAEPEPGPKPEPELAEEAPEEMVLQEVVAPVVAPVSRPVTLRRPRAAAGSKPKAAFTLRLDPERHLKLRLACAVDGRSAQHFVTDALDQLLAKMPELEGMAAKAKRKG
jgi:hypothetical protein